MSILDDIKPRKEERKSINNLINSVLEKIKIKDAHL